MGKKRLAVGQVWAATLHVNPKSWKAETKSGYRFEVLKEINCFTTYDIKRLYLCLKLDVDYESDNPQCWWFDETGRCEVNKDSTMDYFQLTRRVIPKEPVRP